MKSRLKIKTKLFVPILIIVLQFFVEDFILANSDSVRISLLTFGKGNSVADVWGHTGIRVLNADKGTDLVYNYGTYDFNQPNFLLKFLRGKLKYSLSFNDFDQTIRFYTYYHRDVFEQVLNLDSLETLKVLELLEKNYFPENRFYLYDFFYDNCSTRPLSIITNSLQSKLIFTEYQDRKTFRQYLDEEINDRPWLDFGIDLILGMNADKYPDQFQKSFLPLNLKSELSKSQILKAGQSESFVIEEKTIATFDQVNKSFPLLLKPAGIFTFLFVIEILIFGFLYFKSPKSFIVYDKIWFAIAFIASLIITFLWFFTDHTATLNNLNYLVFNPLYLFLFFKNVKLKYWISIVLSILLLIVLLGFAILPQELNMAVLPIAGLLLLKIVKLSFFHRYFKSK
jgi:hypothetical protein